jgi:lysophospholipase L1-like esterase
MTWGTVSRAAPRSSRPSVTVAAVRTRPAALARVALPFVVPLLLIAVLVVATFETPARPTLGAAADPSAEGVPAPGDDPVGRSTPGYDEGADALRPVVETGADGCQVAMVGDSLIAWAVEWHRSALADVDCASLVDALSGRVLADGWQCPPAGAAAGETGADGPCRPSGLELIEQWRESGTLGDLVVVALGTNDAVGRDEDDWQASWERALALAEPRTVLLVTAAARPDSPWADRFEAYNERLAAWCARQSRCGLVDWAASAVAVDAASYTDQVHLTRVATRARARFLAAAVAEVVRTDGRPPAPFPRPTRVFTAPGPPPSVSAPSGSTTSTTSSLPTGSTSTTAPTAATAPAGGSGSTVPEAGSPSTGDGGGGGSPPPEVPAETPPATTATAGT